MITAIAGFFLAAQGHIEIRLLIALLVGLALTIASACICNNYLDRKIDQKMERTAQRGLASGSVSVQAALVLAAVLGIGGTVVHAIYVNLLVAALGVFGFVAYVIIYGVAKRRSVHGTVTGSISGALPPVAGYCAVTGRLDIGALLLFLIVVAWQMPHFFAIALYRMSDYKAAGIPVLPIVRGIGATKLQMIVYIQLFIGAAVGLYVFDYAGIFYLAATLTLGILWLRIGLRGYRNLGEEHDVKWARKMFGFSLLVITGWCVGIIIDSCIH